MARARQSGEVDLGCLGLGLVGLLVLAALLYPFRHTPRQSVEVWFRAAWIVQHWNDAEAFPSGASLCAAPFCTRTDTQRKYVGGNPGHMSESKLHFCPDHESELPRTGSRYDDLVRFIYWGLSMVLSALEAMVACALLCAPFGFAGAALMRQRTGTYLETAGALTLGSGMLFGLCATLAAWFMFARW